MVDGQPLRLDVDLLQPRGSGRQGCALRIGSAAAGEKLRHCQHFGIGLGGGILNAQLHLPARRPSGGWLRGQSGRTPDGLRHGPHQQGFGRDHQGRLPETCHGVFHAYFCDLSWKRHFKPAPRQRPPRPSPSASIPRIPSHETAWQRRAGCRRGAHDDSSDSARPTI